MHHRVFKNSESIRLLLFVDQNFLKKDKENAETVRSDRYVAISRECSVPTYYKLGINRNNAWFQQDGTTCHTSG